jgi:hypothetical protein
MRKQRSKLTEKPEECNFCGYETNELTYYEELPGRSERWLCVFCERFNDSTNSNLAIVGHLPLKAIKETN